MPSLSDRLEYLETIASQLEQGAFTMPTALGPNRLNKNTIKGKSITGVMIDANDLSAIKTSTGSLSVTGNLTIGTGGSLRSGKTAYTDTTNPGYFIGLDSGVPKIRVGNAGHTKGFTWDNSDLTIVGNITATTGTIGGWTIGSTDLTSDAGATGMASSGSYRLWIGDATPANAEFSVTSAGAMSATSGTIGGWTIDSINGLKLGTTTTTRGISTGSTAFYAGNATPSSAPFRVTTSGALTATDATITGTITANGGTIGGLSIGASSITSTNWSITSTGVMTSTSGTVGGLTINTNDLTVPSGKKLKFGVGDYLDDSKLYFEVTTSTSGKIIFKNASYSTQAEIQSLCNSTTSYVNIRGIDTGSRNGGLVVRGDTSDVGTYAQLEAYTTGPTLRSKITAYADGNIDAQLGDAAGSDNFMIMDSGGNDVFGVNSDGELIRPITNDSTAEGAYYGRIPIYINGSLKYISVHSA